MATVLIVDDEPAIVTALGMALDYSGFETIKAANGMQALECLERAKPQAIVSDWMMPRMGGEQLLRHIKSDDSLRAIPVIVMSAIPLAVGFPVAGFLQKPFRVHSLLDLIAQVVRSTVR